MKYILFLLPWLGSFFDAYLCVEEDACALVEGIIAENKLGTFTNCYWEEPNLTFNEAMQACNDKGGHLVHFYSQDVSEMIRQRFPNIAEAWLGAKLIGSEMKYITSLEDSMGIPVVSRVSVTVFSGVTGECLKPSLLGNFHSTVSVPCDLPAPTICQKGLPRSRYTKVEGKSISLEVATEVVDFGAKEEGKPGTTETVWLCGLRCTRTKGCVAFQYLRILQSTTTSTHSHQCRLINKKPKDFPVAFPDSDLGEIYVMVY